MDILSLIHNKKFFGREFLTWLWFQSDCKSGMIALDESQTVEIWVDNKIILESADEETLEKVICQGDSSEMLEARQALKQGKKVSQASFRLYIKDDEWRFTLDDCRLNFRTCKTPKIMLDKKEDPEGLFYEKTFLIQEAVRVVEQLFIQFIKIRISPQWTKNELPALQKWVQK